MPKRKAKDSLTEEEDETSAPRRSSRTARPTQVKGEENTKAATSPPAKKLKKSRVGTKAKKESKEKSEMKEEQDEDDSKALVITTFSLLPKLLVALSRLEA
jgi:hypothetical protein